MTEGGFTFTKESDRLVRYVSLLATPIFVLYGLLVLFGVFPSSNYINDAVCLIILGLWTLTGLYHFFAPITSKSDLLTRFILYESLTLAFIVFISGFLQPFAMTAVLLFLVANLYFGMRGVLYSMLGVVLAGLIDALLRSSSDPSIIVENIIGIISILVIGTAIIAVMSLQESRQAALVKSQKQERLQYDRLLTIINNMTDATFSTDKRGRVQLYNAACLNLLDTNTSLKGKQIGELFRLTDDNGKKIKFHDLLADVHRTTRRDDLRHHYSDDEAIRLEITFAPIRSSFSGKKGSGEVENGYIVIARDVTKEKSLEEERDEFISVVSHELRTPITIVEGTLSNLQVLMKQPKKPAASFLNANLTTAHDQVLYLAKMVNDLSTLSRAERGVADAAEDIDVQAMIHHLHQEYEKHARAKKLHLNLDMSGKLEHIHVSRLYVEELLQNFITNAIKYTEKGTVTITVKQQKGSILFEVKDSGIGISRSDQKKVFEKFYRSEDYRIRETGGTGLGLYVSAKLANKLGTKIELTSRLNHGSTFSFELPSVTPHTNSDVAAE